jgi:hypothetical protein
MSHAVILRRTRSLGSLAFVASFVIALALGLSSCTVRMIADYDAFTVEKTTQLQEQCESLCVALEEAAATPDLADDLYPAQAEAYDAIEVSLRLLESRVDIVKKNEITKEQVGELRKSFEAIRRTHRERSEANPPKGLSAMTVKTLRESLMLQFRSILVLQEALKRGN